MEIVFRKLHIIRKGRRKRGAKLSAFIKDRRKNDHGRPKAKEISLKIRNNVNAN